MQSAANSSGLKLASVSLSLGTRRLLTIDAMMPQGEVLTLMGESGSGKSSLLDFIAGFLSPAFSAEGRVVLNGRGITDVEPQARRTGLMFQSPLLFPHMSVLENLLFALPPSGSSAPERRAIAEAALSEAGLDGLGDRDPATLSGGQQTRAALMRLILARPEALLLDEPFSSLDRARRQEIRELVFSIARQRKLPVLLVTHDREDAEAANGPVITL